MQCSVLKAGTNNTAPMWNVFLTPSMCGVSWSGKVVILTLPVGNGEESTVHQHTKIGASIITFYNTKTIHREIRGRGPTHGRIDQNHPVTLSLPPISLFHVSPGSSSKQAATMLRPPRRGGIPAPPPTQSASRSSCSGRREASGAAGRCALTRAFSGDPGSSPATVARIRRSLLVSDDLAMDPGSSPATRRGSDDLDADPACLRRPRSTDTSSDVDLDARREVTAHDQNIF